MDWASSAVRVSCCTAWERRVPTTSVTGVVGGVFLWWVEDDVPSLDGAGVGELNNLVWRALIDDDSMPNECWRLSILTAVWHVAKDAASVLSWYDPPSEADMIKLDVGVWCRCKWWWWWFFVAPRRWICKPRRLLGLLNKMNIMRAVDAIGVEWSVEAEEVRGGCWWGWQIVSTNFSWLSS